MNSVLIIDDDKKLCALMKKCVEQENLSAVVAHGGLEGLRLLEENKDTEFAINHSRKIWIQVAEGSVSTNEHLLVAGDGLAVSDEEDIIRLRGIDKLSNIIIFNLRA